MTAHATTSALSAQAVAVPSMVGHLLRRCHQVHHAVWAQTVGEVLTSPQFSALEVISAAGRTGVDQSSVGEQAALDRSTVAGVVQRLCEQHWVTRSPDPQDRRRHLLRSTAPADCALAGLQHRVAEVQRQLLAPLDKGEQSDLLRLLTLMTEVSQGSRMASAQAHRPGHLVRRAQQHHAVLWSQEHQPLTEQLTGPQFAVLATLLHRGPQVQGLLAESVALDRSTASDLLARLQRRGLTQRSTLPGDARTRQVELTEAGRQAVLAAAPAAEQVQRRLLAPLEPADRPVVTGLLGAMARAGARPSSGGA